MQDETDTRLKSSSISLSDLNPEVQKKLNKFNTSNDGQLSLEQAVQGLVTLQKQSDNYKKMIWLLIPVLLGLIAATFGTTMLAFKLNQQTQIMSGSSTLVDIKSGDIIKTAVHFDSEDLLDVAFTRAALNIHTLTTDNIMIDINGVFQQTDTNGVIIKTIISSKYFDIIMEASSNSIVIEPTVGYKTNPILDIVIADFQSKSSQSNTLSTVATSISSKAVTCTLIIGGKATLGCNKMITASKPLPLCSQYCRNTLKAPASKCNDMKYIGSLQQSRLCVNY